MTTSDVVPPNVTLAPQRAGIPLPEPTVLSRYFWDGCAEGELRYQRCTECDHAEFDPTILCRACGTGDLVWSVSQGRGEVYSYSTVYRPQTPAFLGPYLVAIVNVDEGFQIISNIVGCQAQDVSIGMRVKVAFHDVDAGVVLPYFTPDSEEKQ